MNCNTMWMVGFLSQIALVVTENVVTEKAAFNDMHVKGFAQTDCAFAGHSLGEYSALASIADVLHISALVDVVFCRGITMQCAAERDSENRSNYAMCAVHASRILVNSASFHPTTLASVSLVTLARSIAKSCMSRSETPVSAHTCWWNVTSMHRLRPAPAPTPEPASDPRWPPCPPTPLPIPLDDVLHIPDPRRDRTNDRGGSLCTGQGIANLGCLFILASGNP